MLDRCIIIEFLYNTIAGTQDRGVRTLAQTFEPQYVLTTVPTVNLLDSVQVLIVAEIQFLH